MSKTRIEKDSMGTMEVPSDAYYGSQTQRAVLNFPISSYRMSRRFIQSIGEIKRASAIVNGKNHWVDAQKTKAIVQASEEVIAGKFDSQFVVDVFQTGSGTSTNMNTNEIIANRASEILGEKVGSKVVHPNDHVNFGQSSNDVYPTAMHISILKDFKDHLVPTLRKFHFALEKKSKTFDDVVKIGRTHLQDATPIRMGQVFSGYAYQIKQSIDRIEGTFHALSELALGGTAVGTGINCPKGFPKEVIAELSKRLELNLKESPNHFASQASKDTVVEASCVLKVLAVALMKIANDVRWLGSGPRCGIGELILPETQPGSSIMPGKVNPVIAESLTMICAQVIGNDTAVTIGGQSGNFELNVMMPMMLHNVLESSNLLQKGVENFQNKCIDGIEVDREQCAQMIEKSLAMVTSLAPVIGYDKAAEIAKESHKTKKSVRQICLERNILPKNDLEKILDAYSMTINS